MTEFSLIFCSRTLFIFYSRVYSFLGGSVVFNILVFWGWTYLRRAPRVPPPDLAASVSTGMAQTSKEANSDRITFLAVLRGSIMYTCIFILVFSTLTLLIDFGLQAKPSILYVGFVFLAAPRDSDHDYRRICNYISIIGGNHKPCDASCWKKNIAN